jgi:ubiquinone/menaquinone biosynthesis C-methylase UbiE
MRSSADGTVRGLYDRYAARYDRDTAFYDRLMLGDGRAWACGPVRGRVLELAVGTGRNLACYPPAAKLVGVDISRGMLDLAVARARARDLPVGLVQADAHALPFASGSCDTVVCTLGLSSIPDPAAAIAEAFRVLRPGGTLRLVGHVPGRYRAVVAVQRLLERQSVRLTGDRQTRPVLPLLVAAGFVIGARHRSRLGVIERLVAVKPDRAAG